MDVTRTSPARLLYLELLLVGRSRNFRLAHSVVHLFLDRDFVCHELKRRISTYTEKIQKGTLTYLIVVQMLIAEPEDDCLYEQSDRRAGPNLQNIGLVTGIT